MNKEQVGKGAIYGSLIGDASGATLEFFPNVPDRDDVMRALQMKGGGYWRTAPGQITDDGEMSICLMSALAGKNHFDIEEVAQAYFRWFKSLPFDMGRTTRNGLSGPFEERASSLHVSMWKAAESRNSRSKANGSLMRIVPLGVWGYRLSERDLVDAACEDSRLTHCSLTCQHACATYCLAIRHLMINEGDSKGAFARAVAWAEKLGNSEIGAWLKSARANEAVGYFPHSGFVKYAYVHAFRHLLLESTYLNSLMETLSGGGDTDTNACIVGGIVGALHGEAGVPSQMINALLKCDTTKGRKRPEFLQTKLQLPRLLEALIK
jgi:ADP-ribosylglycohydrolase